MLGSTTLQWLILPFGFLLLFLHVGPTLGIAVAPSIRAGTRWWFFLGELAIFVGWLLASPIVWASSLARAVVMVHLVIHVSLALGDWFAHERMVATALSPRATRPWSWIAAKSGLLIDTLTHVTVAGVVVAALPWSTVTLVGLLALLGYVVVTLEYLRRFGAGERLVSWRES